MCREKHFLTGSSWVRHFNFMAAHRLRLLEVAHRLSCASELMADACRDLDPTYALFRIAIEKERARVHELIEQARLAAHFAGDAETAAAGPTGERGDEPGQST